MAQIEATAEVVAVEAVAATPVLPSAAQPIERDGSVVVKKPTRQWDAWTRQEEENFFNALRQVGKNFEKITCEVRSKNKDQVRHYYYRLIKRMNKLLGPDLALDAKNSKDANVAMLCWWSLLEKYSCSASKLHLKPRRMKAFVAALENQLSKDRKRAQRKQTGKVGGKGKPANVLSVAGTETNCASPPDPQSSKNLAVGEVQKRASANRSSKNRNAIGQEKVIIPLAEVESNKIATLEETQKKKATGRRSSRTNSLNVRTSQPSKHKRKGKAPGFGQAVLTETVRVEVGSIMPCSDELNSHLLSAVTNAKTVPKPHNRATTKGKSSYRDIMPVAMTEAAATICNLQQVSLLTRTTAMPQPSQEQRCMPSAGLPFMGSPVELERPAELCQAGEAMRVDVTTPKLKLQLFPIDDFTRTALTKDGHNPHLELTFKSKKSVSSILQHLQQKWGQSAIATGELRLFPFSTQMPSILCSQSWGPKDTGTSAADVYDAVGKPAVFRLRYGCIPSRVQEKSEAELQNRASSLQPVHEEGGSRMTSLQDGPVKSCDALLGPSFCPVYPMQKHECIEPCDVGTWEREKAENLQSQLAAKEASLGKLILKDRECSNMASGCNWLFDQSTDGFGQRLWADEDPLQSQNGWIESLTNVSVSHFLEDINNTGYSNLTNPAGQQQFIPGSSQTLFSSKDVTSANDAQQMLWGVDDACDGFSFLKNGNLSKCAKKDSNLYISSTRAMELGRTCSEEQMQDEQGEHASSEEANLESTKNVEDLEVGQTSSLDLYWADSLGSFDANLLQSENMQSHELPFSGIGSLVGVFPESSLDGFLRIAGKHGSLAAVHNTVDMSGLVTEKEHGSQASFKA